MLGILKPFQKLLQNPANDVDIQLKASTTVNSFESFPDDFYSGIVNPNSSKFQRNMHKICLVIKFLLRLTKNKFNLVKKEVF